MDFFWVLGQFVGRIQGTKAALVWVSRWHLQRRLSGKGTRQKVGMCGTSSLAS